MLHDMATNVSGQIMNLKDQQTLVLLSNINAVRDLNTYYMLKL